MLPRDSQTNANSADRSTAGTRVFACALTLLAASCTMNWVRALSSAVRAFGLHPKGRPFKSDSAHHCDAPPFSGDVVQLVRTLPCHSNESSSKQSTYKLTPIGSLHSSARVGTLRHQREEKTSTKTDTSLSF